MTDHEDRVAAEQPSDAPPTVKNPMGLLALELIGAANAAHDLGGAFERIAKLLVEATATAK